MKYISLDEAETNTDKVSHSSTVPPFAGFKSGHIFPGDLAFDEGRVEAIDQVILEVGFNAIKSDIELLYIDGGDHYSTASVFLMVRGPKVGEARPLPLLPDLIVGGERLWWLEGIAKTSPLW